MLIDKENGIPYYRQLAAFLQKQIEEEVYKEGDKIPSEAELSLIFNVNRHTVRQAISELTHLGILYKIKGKGTFVTREKADYVNYRISKKTRFTQNILEVGLTPGAKLNKAVIIPAAEKVARNLNINQGEKVFLLEILRFANNDPFSLSTTYLPEYLTPGLQEKLKNFSSLYQILESHYGLQPARTRSTFHAAFPSIDDSLQLSIPQSLPVLKVESVMVTDNGTAVEYSITRFRGDRGKITVDFI